MQRHQQGTLADSIIAQLYELHAPAIFAYLRQHTASREDAEDVLAEVVNGSPMVSRHKITRMSTHQFATATSTPSMHRTASRFGAPILNLTTGNEIRRFTLLGVINMYYSNMLTFAP